MAKPKVDDNPPGNFAIRTSRAQRSEESIFDKLARQAFTGYELQRLSGESLTFFKTRATRLSGLRGNPRGLWKEADVSQHRARFAGLTWVGKMMLFKYNPKHRLTLPYYDTFPLVFILGFYDDGFLGINLHYIPYKHRAILFMRLQRLSSNKLYDDDTRLRLSYQLLKNVGKLSMFKPCLKRYLWTNVKTKFLHIPSYDWEIAIFLPVQKFKKASYQKVWTDSRKKY